MKYRKKPVVIEAVQWTGNNHAEMCEFIDPEVFEIIPRVGLVIHTLEGDHHASPGDYIIKGVNGEFYPCKPDIFAKTYENVTLTPPNETPPCYQPDGDGCAYQCYDGQDEPIDKCKECPLCYSDKQRQHTPPNEPLTLEQLREMDEPTPVWWKKAGFWCLCERGFIIAPNGNIYEFEETDGAFYRCPPEGEA